MAALAGMSWCVKALGSSVWSSWPNVSFALLFRMPSPLALRIFNLIVALLVFGGFLEGSGQGGEPRELRL